MTAPRVPKYIAIATDLSAKIRAGDYSAGAALPGQRELSSAYGVTLATLRQALQILEGEGLVSQQPGRGTFVAEPRAAYRMDELLSLADDLRGQGVTVSTEIITQAFHKAPAPVATQLDTTGRALRLERVRLVSGRPAIHQVSWVREPHAAGLIDVDFSANSLYDALADRGVVVHRATERLRPAVLDDATGALLRQPAGTPVFVSERTTFGLDDAPVVFDRATILGDAIEVRTERAASRMSFGWHRKDGAARR